MSLTERSTHFEFGENWRDYAKSIDQPRIDAAIAGLRKLFPDGLAGKTFLDIGCGSGLHALAAMSLGARSVTALDIDENSVGTTRDFLTKHSPGAKWTANVASVFDLSPETTGTFDVVYSWGVLHHTGDMWRAIERAGRLVRPGGQFAIAIYSATTLDLLWKIEKRLYYRAPKAIQWIVRQSYVAVYMLAKALVERRSPASFLSDYQRHRGMNFSHDAHDWLGGYPYETASADEMRERVAKLGFKEINSFARPKTIGAFGTGCGEFVFEKDRIKYSGIRR